MVLVVTVLSLLLAAFASAEQEYLILVTDQNMGDVNAPIIQMDDMETREVDNSLETDIKATLTDDLPPDVQLCIDGLEKLQTGSYQPSTLNMPCTNLCELIKNDTCFYPIVQQKSEGTLPSNGCPFRAGKYIVNNLRLEVPCLPDKIPGGECWKFKVRLQSANGIKIYYNNEVLVEFPKKDGSKTPAIGR